ncbi:uncharacterized protein SPPG_08376 [Spizellomyces punctatus DAOM BR117]|uniref:F-box domain-containing protein n=1 Tax=Spizellomyces punctatus (strain DAOM BR117) TaxID=645134 RepID=A0A0L0H682_SPIPD|nr:uncharacterized protein SPPG_08376 [Spizellomyces punctatus DAOM BR117]KNC96223.1 hypothetical protein SPPG_08376 [Spizellomyces punctatus DAOM BR117]|eukprot:XP_016604263.1 hypothetical protein SPPG_08376 [Spizellomyces punctatus DAOM BR117]
MCDSPPIVMDSVSTDSNYYTPSYSPRSPALPPDKIDSCDLERTTVRWALQLSSDVLQQIRDGRRVSDGEWSAALCAADLCNDLWPSEAPAAGRPVTPAIEKAHLNTDQKAHPLRRKSNSRAAVLPPELIRTIFSYVDSSRSPHHSPTAAQERAGKQSTLLSCLLVNRHWYSVASARLWRNPYLPSLAVLLRLVFCTRLSSLNKRTSLGNKVYRLDLFRLRLREPAATSMLHVIARSFPELRVLRLDIRQFTARTINYLFECCRHLHTFALRGDPNAHTGRYGKEEDWAPSNVVHFVAGLGKLKALDLHNMKRDERTATIYHTVMNSVGSNLRHLNLGRTWVLDDVVIGIARRCSQLETIVLEENLEITDVAIKALAESCPQLRFVKLRNCIGIGDEGVTALALSCPNLEALGISYSRCTDRSLKVVARSCKNLHTLFMNDLWLESEDTLIELVERRGARLKTLGMCGCEVVSDRFIQAVAKNCPVLQELDIAGCGGDDVPQPITQASLEELMSGCTRLRSLLVNGIDGLSDEFVLQLSRQIWTEQFWLEPPEELSGT